MKLVGIVGSNYEPSYNRLLLQNIQDLSADLFELELLEIKDVPLFNQSEDQMESEPVQYLTQKIEAADGVILSTPEHNRTVPPALKSVLEWLSFKVHPFENKPVLIVGASYFDQGTSRAQLHLKQIMESPGVGAYVFPGNEFLLGDAREAFDENGGLKNQATVGFLRNVLEKFVRYVRLINRVEETTPAAKEYTVAGDTYVELNRGLLTVDQLNHFLHSMPMDLAFVDQNNRVLYEKPSSKDRESNQLMSEREPLEALLSKLRTGELTHFRAHLPSQEPDQFLVKNYRAIRDKDGNYMGINQYVQDLQPIVDWYLEKTGQELADDPSQRIFDGTTAAAENEMDAISGASEKTDK